jgi:hypothetical protein
LALAALVVVWSRALATQLWPVLGLFCAFVVAIVAFRSRWFFPRRTRTRLLIESWSMVMFITGVLWFTGKSGSPLLNLYLLPIILSAFTLGRLVTLLQVAVIAICHVLPPRPPASTWCRFSTPVKRWASWRPFYWWPT